MYLTNEVPSTASEQNNQGLHEQYLAIQEECGLLRQHYQTLYDHFHTFLTCAPLGEGHDQDRASYRQAMKGFHQSLHEHRSKMRHFRHALHAHLMRTRSVRDSLTRNTPAPPSRMRKIILLGLGDAQEAAVLLERMQHTGAHRVFVAVDWSQVLCILHNVYLDVLVLDDDLTPLPAMQLSHYLHSMPGLERLPIIVLSDFFNPLFQEEYVSTNLVGLEKPITGAVLMEAIDQLVALGASCSNMLERQTDAGSLRGISELPPAFV